MKYYTETISPSIAEKLKEKGMPIRYANRMINACPDSTRRVDVIDKVLVCPMYAEVFDWLMDKGISCEVTRSIDFAREEVSPEWDWYIEKTGPLTDAPGGYADTWIEAAEKSVIKALESI